MNLRDPRKFVLQRVGRLVSWFAGLSLGSLFFGILLTLIILAVFVRTEFFQKNLRDRVVELAQKNLQLDIEYESAEIEVFRLYPRLSFRKVRMEEARSKTPLMIDRVSVSISAFVSIPLLLFQRIHIASAEVEGLQFSLTETKTLNDWMKRLNPARREESKTQSSSFSANIEEIHFQNFKLFVDLSDKDVLKQKISGQFELRDFRLSFDQEEILFEGEFPVRNLELGPIQVESGEMRIVEGRYLGRRLAFERLTVTSGEDEIDLSGTVTGFEKPALNLKASASLEIGNYSKIPAKGRLDAKMRYQGIWKQGKGSFEFALKEGFIKSRQFDAVEGQLRIRERELDVLDFEFKRGSERITAKGAVGIEGQKSELNLKLQDLDLPQWLALIEDHLGVWRGRVSGNLDLRGDILAGAIEGDARLRAIGYEVHTEEGGLRYAAPDAQVESKLNFKSWEEGVVQSSVTTAFSQWTSSMRWDAKEFWIDWKGKTDGPMGRLFYFDLETRGDIEGFYGGPFRAMDLKIVPRLKTIKLNDQIFKNLRGQIDFDEKRQFVANPLEADEFKANGGFLFPRVGETEFFNFSFETKSMSLRTILNSLPMTKSWAIKPEATAATKAFFHGLLDEPRASGEIFLERFRLENESESRTIQSKFRFESGYFRAFDINFEGPSDSGNLKADLLVSTARIEALKLTGRRLRLADWANVFGLQSPIQSRADMDFSFDASAGNLSLESVLKETSMGSQVQGDSQISVRSSRASFQLNAQLFGGLVRLSTAPENSSIFRLELKRWDLSSVFEELNRGGISWKHSGSGSCRMPAPRPRAASDLLDYLPSFELFQCNLNFSESALERGGAQLLRLEPFDLGLDKKASQSIEWSSPLIVLSAARQRLELSGRFRSPQDLVIRMQGRAPLDALSYFFDETARSEGVLEIDGVWSARGYSGAISLSKGLLVFKESPILLREVEAIVRAQNSNFELQSLTGSLREGSLSASGRLQLKGFDLEAMQLTTQLNGTLIEPDSGIRFRSSGPLFIRLEKGQGKVSGQLSISEGRFRKRINLRADLAKMFTPDRSKYEFYVRESSFFDPWRLDIALSTSEPFQVRNNIAEGDFDAQMRIQGTIREPRVIGSAGALRGRFNYFNRSFEIRTATAQFNNPNSNIPRYDIRADTEVGEYRIFISVVGDAATQKVSYNSDPPLAERQILSLVSTGTPPSTSEQAIQDDRTTSAAYAGISFVTGQLQDTIESALSTDFGIQRFQIYPSFYEETGKTELQLKVGTDLIRNRLSLNYSNYLSATGGHLVELDLRVNRSLSLVGSWRDTQKEQRQNISGDIGGDLLFRFEVE